jgi:CHASE2 domain-containing sensor protein
MGGAARRRILGLLAVGVLAAGAGLAAHAAGLLAWLESPSVDARFSLRGSEGPPHGIVVVGVDNDSLAVLPRHPFPRSLDALVLDRLHAAGARLIVYDESFDRPAGPESESIALFEAARRAAPVVFATTLISPTGETLVLGGNPNLVSIGARAGAAYLPVDPDGVLRHTVYEVNHLPSIATAVAAELDRHPPPRHLFGNGWIDFRGPPGTIHNIPFVRVLHNQFNPAQVRGKIVVIGATAPVLQDLHSTAAGSPMSGPEVQAEAISTALSDFALRTPSGAITVLLIVALALLAPLAGMRLETVGVLLVGLAAATVWSVATQLAFNSGAVLDYSDPLASLLLATGATVTLGMWADSRERKRLRLLFAAGSGEVVEQVLSAAGPRRLEPTAIIGGYRIEEIVGHGGMGVVYRATQLTLGREVAIKLIAAEKSEDPVFRERFKAESRMAASIEHASVIPVYEAGEDDGLLFIAMRLVDGFDLAQLLARSDPLEPLRAVRIVEQIAGALDAAHARGLIHRDVKPANILLTREEPEHAYLTDFGVAEHTVAGADMPTADQWVGTLDYMAPEQIRGEAIDARADIYALTCVLHHCLTGQTPFPRDTQAAKLWAHVNAPPPAPNRLRSGLPEALDDVIARGMAKNPADRFPSAALLAQASARALGVPVADSVASEPPAAADHVEQPPGQAAPTAISDN